MKLILSSLAIGVLLGLSLNANAETSIPIKETPIKIQKEANFFISNDPDVVSASYFSTDLAGIDYICTANTVNIPEAHPIPIVLSVNGQTRNLGCYLSRYFNVVP
jgi:hypothetical protein